MIPGGLISLPGPRLSLGGRTSGITGLENGVSFGVSQIKAVGVAIDVGILVDVLQLEGMRRLPK